MNNKQDTKIILDEFYKTINKNYEKQKKLLNSNDKEKIEKEEKEGWRQADERVKNSINKVKSDKNWVKTFENLSKM